MNLEDELGCEGFYGFGSGYLMGRALKGGGEQALHHPKNQNYCGGACARSQSCWWRHKGRVVWLTPDLTALLEGLAHDPLNPLQGPALIREYAERTKQDSARSMVEPYVAVMGGNIEDGMACGAGGQPKDRGPFHRLPWPLTRKLPS